MKPEASGDNAGDKVEACPSPVSKNNFLPPPCSCSFLICLVVVVEGWELIQESLEHFEGRVRKSECASGRGGD